MDFLEKHYGKLHDTKKSVLQFWWNFLLVWLSKTNGGYIYDWNMDYVW